MKIIVLLVGIFACYAVAAGGAFVRRHIDALPTLEGTRASFDFLIPREHRAVLVLLPGANGDGKQFLSETNWTAFAERQGWALVATTFISPTNLLKKDLGYYNAEKESGRMLLAAIEETGLAKEPIYVFGFSGGARFAASFAMTHSKKVSGWVAHAPSDVVKIRKGETPPGIVACGEYDQRLGATFAWFKDLRSSGSHATWVEIAGVKHSRDGRFEEFSRRWFAENEVRIKRGGRGVWCDLGDGTLIGSNSVCAEANRSWFPSRAAYDDWRSMVADTSRKIEMRQVRTQVKNIPALTLFLVAKDCTATNLLCLSLLANRPSEVQWILRRRARKGTVGSFLDYADSNKMAVVAWGAPRGLWQPRFNWNDIRADKNRSLSRSFGQVVGGWCKGMDGFADEFGIPRNGYLMAGFSGAAQFAQRLALHAPNRFKAVAIHVASSYDYPLPLGRGILWCVTTGENESGYERSRRFIDVARTSGYAVIYKAYPGLGHSDSSAACALAQACFTFAMACDANKGWDTMSWPIVADVVNQRRCPRSSEADIPLGFRILLPCEKVARAWERL